MEEAVGLAFRRVLAAHLARRDGAAEVPEDQHVADLDPLVVGLVGELEAEHPEVREVLPVDARVVACYHNAQTEVARGQRGVLAGRALSVVAAPDHAVVAGREDLVGRDVVAHLEQDGEFEGVR